MVLAPGTDCVQSVRAIHPMCRRDTSALTLTLALRNLCFAADCVPVARRSGTSVFI